MALYLPYVQQKNCIIHQLAVLLFTIQAMQYDKQIN